ncbi:hypothetical protein FVE85_2907 [Porphyridium purpureum]|uniref:Uncharacterized protein n=1 Tax=Porphyridium purpureum TaxID=35688 RepID=A0A5J4YTI7_PORPP|nr:hypothetical protein FVE85_2907 [Porphyridium purpureum]|eukprot:POR1115..scf227_4
MERDDRIGLGAPSSRGRPRKHPRDRPRKSGSSAVAQSAARPTAVRGAAPQVPAQQTERHAAWMDEGGGSTSSDGSGIDMEELLQRLNLPVWDEHEEFEPKGGKLRQHSMQDSEVQELQDEQQQWWTAEFCGLESLLARAPINELLDVPFEQCHIFGLTADELAERNVEAPLRKWTRQKNAERQADSESVTVNADAEESRHAQDRQHPADNGDDVFRAAIPDLSAPAETLNEVGDSAHNRAPDDFDSFLDDMGA